MPKSQKISKSKKKKIKREASHDSNYTVSGLTSPSYASLSDDSNAYEIEAIRQQKSDHGRKYFLVKWKGYDETENSWVLRSDFNAEAANDMLKEFEQSQEEIKHKQQQQIEHIKTSKQEQQLVKKKEKQCQQFLKLVKDQVSLFRPQPPEQKKKSHKSKCQNKSRKKKIYEDYQVKDLLDLSMYQHQQVRSLKVDDVKQEEYDDLPLSSQKIALHIQRHQANHQSLEHQKKNIEQKVIQQDFQDLTLDKLIQNNEQSIISEVKQIRETQSIQFEEDGENLYELKNIQKKIVDKNAQNNNDSAERPICYAVSLGSLMNGDIVKRIISKCTHGQNDMYEVEWNIRNNGMKPSNTELSKQTIQLNYQELVMPVSFL